MVVIRLARGGAKKNPFYNIVVANKASPRDGRFIERIGYFNPAARGKETRLTINKERIDHWINQGAQPSDRVCQLFKAFVKQDDAVIKAAPTRKEQKAAQQEQAKAQTKKKLEEAEQAAKAKSGKSTQKEE